MNAFTTIPFGCTPTGINVSSEYSDVSSVRRGLAFLDHRHVPRLRVEHKQIIFIRRERQPVGAAAHGQRVDAAAKINVIHGDAVRAEVAHVEPRIIRA